MSKLTAIMLTTGLVLTAGCSPLAADPAGAERISRRCGVDATLFGYAEDPDHPPACNLPAAEDVASSCSARDAMATPGFQISQIPEYDDNGYLIHGTPFPLYQTDELSCAFIDDDRNRAQCTFRLIKPDQPNQAKRYRVSMEHNLSLMPSEVIHGYRTYWSLDGECLPDN